MLNKIINAIRKRSVSEICIFIIHSPFYFYDKYTEKRFDRYYGTDTNQKLPIKEYNISSPNLEHACWYEAITKKFFTKMIRQMSIDFKKFVFIDLGSGKGKSLMFAADYPFRKIVGVEFSSELHQTARNNINLFAAKEDIHNKFQLFCMDAELYDFPPENIVLFLYNPFQGKVMKSVVKKIEQFLSSGQYKVFILYRNPKCTEMFENNDFLKIVKETPDYKIYTGIKNDNEKMQ